MMHHEGLNRIIDLSWRSEMDINGNYILVVLNCLETFDSKTNEFALDVNWKNPNHQFESNNRQEVVYELERLFLQLRPFKDPRILLKQGVVDEPSESFRSDLEHNGFTQEIADKIIRLGNAKIQDLLIDHKAVDKVTLSRLAEEGIKKGVRKKALQKLNSKRFQKGL